MKKVIIIQWGLERSIVLVTYPDTNEEEYMIMNNDYLMSLDERELVYD